MLTFDDCLGLSGLTPEEVAAIAKHEHLPAIVALEMGWTLSRTPEGRQLIQRMILDDIKDACGRGDRRAAAELELALRHFLETHPARPGAAKARRRTGGAAARSTTFDEEGDRQMQAFGIDTMAAPWLRSRGNLYLEKMLQHFGLDHASVRDRFRPEMQAAERRCATCAEIRRCRRFLAGVAGAEPPAAFCPNAALFEELARHSSPH